MPVPKLKAAEEGNGFVTVEQDVGGEKIHLPILIYPDGQERPLDYPSLIKSVKTVSDERETLKTSLETLKTEHEALTARFNGADPEEFFPRALSAIETVDGLESGDLADAETMKRVKEEVSENWKTKLKDADTRYKDLDDRMKKEVGKRDNEIREMRLTHAFASSPFVREKLNGLPLDMAQAYFSRHFKDNGGKLEATFPDGSTIYDRSNPSEVAGFDEALAQLVDRHPEKSKLLGGLGGDGGGTPPHSARGVGDGTKTISRSNFDKLPPNRKEELMKTGFTIEDAA